MSAQPARVEPETAQQWWARVLREHGEPPQHVRDAYATARRSVAVPASRGRS
ncbi:hypothetical protein G7075_04475 [Phycicoccus sp. HDW14]|uniref:hypothetical protein n=1 Tax=Phycicoccus sp. HDW14 TaxID=2714941 RepID=UPI00140947C8|nr:hypothetical protein [Phycicoccus sp. HDW14]QIM20573.1 hypothetical protein G7075_04475 [Phycicoccus sp. HDW14]